MATAPDHTLLTAARIAMRYPHSPREAAQRFGMSTTTLHNITDGTVALSDRMRARLHEAIRDEELELADKICRECGW